MDYESWERITTIQPFLLGTGYTATDLIHEILKKNKKSSMNYLQKLIRSISHIANLNLIYEYGNLIFIDEFRALYTNIVEIKYVCSVCNQTTEIRYRKDKLWRKKKFSKMGFVLMEIPCYGHFTYLLYSGNYKNRVSISFVPAFRAENS